MERETQAVEDPCPFCEIARGEDHSVEIVCEDRTWVAFFPPEPATPGHTLVIPRVHAQDLWTLDPDVAAELMRAASRVGRAIDGALSPEGMNLITSAGNAAEQTVLHVHLHVVPRWKRDGFGEIWPPKRRMDEALEDDLARRIRDAC